MDEMKPDVTKVEPVAVDPEMDAAMQRDVLISQIVDGEGDGAAWKAFAELAGQDASIWRELALAQRGHAALSHAVSVEISGAASVELTDAAGASGGAGPIPFSVSRWSGWVAAAAVGIAWVGMQYSAIRDSRTAEMTSHQAGIAPVGAFQVDSPQDAISAYKALGHRSGTVLGELPDRVIIESRPLAGERGFEVVYLRQFMERARVSELYQVTRDDSGQQGLLVPVVQSSTQNNTRID